MNHDYINKSNLIDQYLLGRLTGDEAERFEDHFIDCPECVEQLNITRSFIGDLKALAVQQTLLSEPKAASVTRRWPILDLVPVPAWAGIALASVLLAGIFALYSVRKINRLNAELQQAKVENQHPQDFGFTAQLEKQRQEIKEQPGDTIPHHDLQAKNEVRTKKSTARPTETAETNFKIFTLISTRGEVPIIAPPTRSSSFAFSIPMEGANFDLYRVTILNRQKTVWQQSDFKLDDYGSLSLRLRSNFLSSGIYDLKVEGRTAPNQWSVVGSYPFSFAKQ